ncbi:MAG: metal ABC transporter ATP-binding protein [Thaumarchaeota archaeon]|nr:metal ABC transporter ATP-binding protein [Candidatus Calditenuaceae archaeon]MDW8041407.1 metal ABC transporter ATP-binding protein [Nitrososphaerota archaeon]
MTSVVEVRDLAVSYATGTFVVQNVSFDVRRGEVAYILGPNGGGKTTILKALIGAVKPSKGTVKLFGKDIKEFKEWWRIGYVPQNAPATLSKMAVSVDELLKAISFSGRRSVDRVEVLKLVGFQDATNLLRRPLFSLSGGEFQRVVIAAALINSPELLLLDEPTTYVDPTGISKVMELVWHLNRDFGMTILMVTHDVSVIGYRDARVLCVNRDRFYTGLLEDLMSSEELCRVYGFHVYTVGHSWMPSERGPADG